MDVGRRLNNPLESVDKLGNDNIRSARHGADSRTGCADDHGGLGDCNAV